MTSRVLEAVFCGLRRDLGSVAVQRREAIAVVRRIAEGELTHAGVLDEEADVVLIRHADASVHLHGLVGDQHVRV